MSHPCDAMRWSAVCDCVFSWSLSLTLSNNAFVLILYKVQCSYFVAQMSVKFILHINVKISRINTSSDSFETRSFFSASYLLQCKSKRKFKLSCVWHEKSFMALGPGCISCFHVCIVCLCCSISSSWYHGLVCDR